MSRFWCFLGIERFFLLFGGIFVVRMFLWTCGLVGLCACGPVGLRWACGGLVVGTMHEGNACSAHAETGAAVVVPNGGIYVGKDVNCAGDVVSFCSSDQRLKDRIKLIDDPLERLNKIKGVTFEWNTLQGTYSGEDTGIIAQDIEQTELPGVVTTRDDGYKAVRYDRLIPLLVESVKQLNSKVEDLSRIVNRHGLQ